MGPGVKRADAVFAFLAEHRGEAFCTECIGIALGKRVDSAIREAEGRGARRRHDRCSRCEQRRLVAGLER